MVLDNGERFRRNGLVKRSSDTWGPDSWLLDPAAPNTRAAVQTYRLNSRRRTTAAQVEKLMTSWKSDGGTDAARKAITLLTAAVAFIDQPEPAEPGES